MIYYIVYALIIIILVFISIIAIKAINRGIEAKQKLKEEDDFKNEENKNNKK